MLGRILGREAWGRFATLSHNYSNGVFLLLFFGSLLLLIVLDNLAIGGRISQSTAEGFESLPLLVIASRLALAATGITWKALLDLKVRLEEKAEETEANLDSWTIEVLLAILLIAAGGIFGWGAVLIIRKFISW